MSFSGPTPNFRKEPSSNDKKKDSRVDLLVGCGHAFSFDSCGFSHPKSQFITVSLDEKAKPDIHMDITRETFHKKLEQDFNQFQSVICEGLDLSVEKSLPLRKYLQDKANMVYVGGVLFELIEILPCDYRIWVGFKEDYGRVITIIPNNDNESKLELGAALHRYIQKYFSKDDFIEHFKPIIITEDLKFRAKQLDKFLYRKTGMPNSVVMQALTDQFNRESIIAGQLKKLAEEYKPGFLRRKIGSGKTKGMDELNDFLRRFDDDHVLTDEELENLFKKVAERQVRLNISLNPTRDSTGQTTHVYNRLAVLILSHFAGKKEKADLKPRRNQP